MDYSLKDLDAEFSLVLNHFQPHHTTQRNHIDYYLHSAFYKPSLGQKIPKNKVAKNYLKAFADKNVNYTSTFPTIKVPAPDTDKGFQEIAQRNEKILYATHEENQTEVLHKKWAPDGTLMSEAFAETTFDLIERRVKIKRLDPRHCYYKFSSQDQDKLLAFWYAVPMSIVEIEAEYGIKVSPGNIDVDGIDPSGQTVIADDTERAWVITRWDSKKKVMWAGNQFIVEPHNHTLPFGIPIDRYVPFTDLEVSRFPQFFLEQIIPLQAEINDTMRKKRLINERLSSFPLVVKGISPNQVDKVKDAVFSGGFIGLKIGGDASFLQATETKALNEHMADLFQAMKDITGYPTVTFGEIAGANTSGDAVSMYFQPTTQTAQNQWISLKAFYESINEKILRLYEHFGKKDEKFKLYGVVPRMTFEVVGDKKKAKESSFSVEFTGKDIGGYYRSQVIVPQITPKDELAYKRLVMDAANSSFLPKVVAYDEWGCTDPQEWIELLAQETSDPQLNPEGMSKLMGAIPTDPAAAPGTEAMPEDMPDELANVIGGENVELGQENSLASVQ
jgi:hypothetical protein